MPFIRGRYHINPVMGEALEAAREAEAALHAPEQEDGEPYDQADGFASPHASDSAAQGPVHRVEIEAAEMVPSHSGRAARGCVARVRRLPAGAADGPSGGDSRGSRGTVPAPETHVFSDHRDLVNFLHDELGKR